MNNDEDGYKETPFYHLPLYKDATPQDLRDGYNRAMQIIDHEIHKIRIKIEENR